MKKKFLQLTFAFLLLLAGATSVSAQLPHPFLDGSGTASDPYLISIRAHLLSINSSPAYCASGVYYRIVNDIDLSTVAWTPIGTTAQPFQGNISGGNHRITNLKVLSGSNIGLFGVTSGATIDSIFVDGDVSGSGSVGLLVGNANSGTINNCKATGTVITTGSDAGGLIGLATGTINMRNCRAMAPVTATGASTSNVGGLIGRFNIGSISESFATGDIITAGTYAGGLIGSNGIGIITDCYATGNVTTSVSWGNQGTMATANTNITCSGDNGCATVTPTTGGGTGTTANYWPSPNLTAAMCGGLVGSNGGIVNKCYASGSVEATVLSPSFPHGFTSTQATGSGSSTSCSTCYDGVSYYPCDYRTATCTYYNYAQADFRQRRAEYVGGLIGGNTGSVNNSRTVFATITGDTYSGRTYTTAGGTVLTTSQLTVADGKVLGNYPFGSEWTIFPGKTYPQLQKSVIDPFPYYNNILCSGTQVVYDNSLNHAAITIPLTGSLPGTVYNYTLRITPGATLTPTVSGVGVTSVSQFGATTPSTQTSYVVIDVDPYNGIITDPQVRYTTTIATVRPQPTIKLIAADTTLCYASNGSVILDSAVIKTELTGTSPFTYRYTKYGTTTGLALGPVASPVNILRNSGAIAPYATHMYVDAFKVKPDHVDITSPLGGSTPATTGYNLDGTFIVKDFYGCTAGTVTPLTQPDTVIVNPLPLVNFPYAVPADWHGVGNFNDTVLCNFDTLQAKVFTSPTIAPAHADSMHYDWMWVNSAKPYPYNIAPFNNTNNKGKGNNVDPTVLNIASSGRDSILTAIARNQSDSVQRSYFRILPSFTNYKGGKCYAKIGDYGQADMGVTDFGITVNPTPMLDIIPDSQLVCNDSLTSTIKFRVTNIKAGQDSIWYSWYNHAPAMGLNAHDSISPVFGKDSIAPFIAINRGRVPIYDSIRVYTYFTNRVTCGALVPPSPNAQMPQDTMTVLRINPTTTIEYNPVDTFFCDPSIVKYELAVKAYGSDISYQWYRSFNKNKGYPFEAIPGAVNATYFATENGDYFVQLNSRCENPTSDTARVDFARSPELYANLLDTTDICRYGKVVLRAPSDGLNFQWYYEDRPIPGETNDSLVIVNSDPLTDYGLYKMVSSAACPAFYSTTNPTRLWVVSQIDQPIEIMNLPDVVNVGETYRPYVGNVNDGFPDVSMYIWQNSDKSIDCHPNEGEQAFGTSVIFTHANVLDTLKVDMIHACAPGGRYTAMKEVEVKLNTAIEDVRSEAVVIYPNPVAAELHISSPVAIQSVKVTNLNGVVVYSQPAIGETTVTIAVGTWNKGTYLVTVVNADGSTVHKIVKN